MWHVPKAARHKWARTLVATIQEDNGPWLRLYILARCVLVARPGEQGTAGGR